MYYIKLTGGFRLNKTFELPDARFILHAAAAWAAAALVLALLAAFAVSQFSIPAGTIGYISSAMSFIAALIAGRAREEDRSGVHRARCRGRHNDACADARLHRRGGQHRGGRRA